MTNTWPAGLAKKLDSEARHGQTLDACRLGERARTRMATTSIRADAERELRRPANCIVCRGTGRTKSRLAELKKPKQRLLRQPADGKRPGSR